MGQFFFLSFLSSAHLSVSLLLKDLADPVLLTPSLWCGHTSPNTPQKRKEKAALNLWLIYSELVPFPFLQANRVVIQRGGATPEGRAC